MQNPLLTNILLAVIAALLLVQVIQNGMSSEQGARTSSIMPPYVQSSERNPTVNSSTPMMGHSMFEQALVGFPEGCDRSKILAMCDSPAARVVKEELNQLTAQGMGPRQVFDHVVAKYGMNALTQEAQKIRSMRKSH
jgi:hypothetical protein